MSENIIVGKPLGPGDLVPKYRVRTQWRASCRHCFRTHSVSEVTLRVGRCPLRPLEDLN